MTCSTCGAANADGAKFCSGCGTALAKRCPACGTAASGRFCSECGTELNAASAAASTGAAAPVAERRITSVLFADLVGFTPLSEARDAEDVRELLSRYFAVARTVIHRYGGSVEKFIGDAVMAVWGVPAAREDDAERAVRAGLDLVDAVTMLGDEVGAAGLAMRVGIVTGEVATTLGATGEGMVAGDAVNTAARIQTAAAPGEVWVDATTRALTSAAVAYRDAGSHLLKGKAEPLPLFAAHHVVASVGGAQRVDGLEAPFVGRDREMRLVKELFHATFEEGRPRLVAVSGLPGVGKSRLGWEFFKYVDGISDVVRWHRGRCLAYGDGVAFWALAEMVRSRLDILEGDDQVVVAHKLRLGLERWVRDPEERGWLLPRMATLLGVAEAGATFGREDLFSSWQLFFELVGDGALGVALLVEDLQWADDGLLDFIDHVLARSQSPIFVLTLSRPEITERRPGWATGRRATPLHLEPLPDTPMAAVVDGLVDGLPDAMRSALIARAEGIPLYAVETVRSLIDRDAVVPRDGRYVVADDGDAVDLDAMAAPTSLHTLLAARLDSLADDERQAVQNAAVLGLSFTRRALEVLTAGTGVADLDAALAALVRKEILALDSDPRSPERGQYRFVQAMLRSVAYETLAKRDRKVRHLQAAAHLADEPDADSFAAVLAAHLIDARSCAPDDPDADDLADRAVALLERAAARAHTLGAPAQALKHYDLALSLVSADAAVGRLSTAAAVSAMTAGRVHDAEVLAERGVAAYDAAGMPIEQAVALSHLGDAQMLAGQGSDVPDRLVPVYRRLEGMPGAEPALTRLARVIGRAYFAHLSDADASFPWWERAVDLAEAEEDFSQLTMALSGYGAALLSAGRPMMGLGILRIALDVAREHEFLEEQLVPLNNLASFLAARDATAARGYVEEGLALAQRLGDEGVGVYLTNTAVLIYWICGEWDRATVLVQRSMELAPVTAMAIAYAAAIAAPRGTTYPATTPDAASTAPQVRAPADALRAHALSAAGDTAGAVDAALDALHTFHGFGGFDDDFPLFWTLAFEFTLDAGEVERAHEVLRLVSDAPRGKVSPFLRALVPYFRARFAAAAGGDAALIDADFTAGAEGLRTFGSPYWLARCLVEHAEWSVGAGSDGELEGMTLLLDEAERLFTELSATPWVLRAQRARALALR